MDNFRLDQRREEIHGPRWNWNQLWDNFLETGGNSLKTGGAALGVATLGLLAVKTVQIALPSIWGTLPAGAIVGLSTVITMPLSRKIAKHIILDDNDVDDDVARALIRAIMCAAATLITTALCTPKFSSMICPHRVSYLGAIGYGTIGAFASGFMELMEGKNYPDLNRPYTSKAFSRVVGSSFAAGVLTITASSALLIIGALWSRLCGDATSIIKGGVSVGSVGGVAVSTALLSANWKKYSEREDNDPLPTWDLVARVAATLAFTVAVAPIASKYLFSNYQVSYLQAAGMSVGAVAGAAGIFFGGCLISELIS